MSRFRDDRRGFTPMAGTGLLIGVVVLLLAVVGAAVFGFIDGVAPPEAEMEIDAGGGEVTITYLAGEPIRADELYVRGDDPDDGVQFGGWPADGLVEPGDRITVEGATGNEEVEVVWNPAAFDRQKTLESYDPDEAELEGWEEDPFNEGFDG
ncbi:type IV pilin [Halorubrum vacuolatum]|uniref:Archaeal Type IV pilin N-terminal domain-containing protein n=1 Tax=Halorubrum vacuolatum TaxID=63740 RepID=A0A238XAF0_HALVU|nr:type IV pilin [Halorubrum vacuolatum]SNR55690.1 Protein of unknown function [Halorubrum vacuolatum]